MKSTLKRFLIPWLLLVAVLYTSSLTHHHKHHGHAHNHPCKRSNHTQQILKNSATELTDDESDIEEGKDDTTQIKFERNELETSLFYSQNFNEQVSHSKSILIKARPLYLLNCSLRI